MINGAGSILKKILYLVGRNPYSNNGPVIGTLSEAEECVRMISDASGSC